jgi:tetratricopeptide (TPR) repeat protein
MFLASREQFEQAIKYGRQAVELDPLSLVANFFMEWIYWYAERFDDALEQINKMLEIEPDFSLAYWQMGTILVAKGMFEEGIAAYQKALALNNSHIVLSFLGVTYGTFGKQNEALEVLNQLLEMKKYQYIPAINIARVYSGLGETDKAFEWLEKAVEERNGELVYLNIETKVGTGDVWGKSVRQDPRLPDLLRRVGLTL